MRRCRWSGNICATSPASSARERDSYPAIPAGYFDAETEARLADFERRARARTQAGAERRVARAHASAGHRDRRRGDRDLPQLARLSFRRRARGIAARQHLKPVKIMRPDWSALKARVSNRLGPAFLHVAVSVAKQRPDGQFHLRRYPQERGRRRRPHSRGVRCAGNVLCRRAGWSISGPGHWTGVSADEIVGLHRGGHEIACHTFSHMPEPPISTRRRWPARWRRTAATFWRLDPSIRIENFAYPYGLGSVSRKAAARKIFRSSRGIVPGVNSGVVGSAVPARHPSDQPGYRPRRRRSRIRQSRRHQRLADFLQP